MIVSTDGRVNRIRSFIHKTRNGSNPNAPVNSPITHPDEWNKPADITGNEEAKGVWSTLEDAAQECMANYWGYYLSIVYDYIDDGIEKQYVRYFQREAQD